MSVHKEQARGTERIWMSVIRLYVSLGARKLGFCGPRGRISDPFIRLLSPRWVPSLAQNLAEPFYFIPGNSNLIVELLQTAFLPRWC